MSNKIKKTILVTGGGKGIGRSICIRFAQAGFHVIACGRTLDTLESLQNDIQNTGGSCWIDTCDVRDPLAIAAFVAKAIVENNESIDVLVNNAGIFIPGQIHNEENGVYEDTMRTNVDGTYHFCRNVIPLLKKSNSAHIFNICSTASITPYANGGSYCISKYAQYGLTKVLREELKEYNIKVSAVLPGATLTDSWKGTDLPPERFLQPETVAKIIYNSYDLGRNGVVEDLLIRPMAGDIS